MAIITAATIIGGGAVFLAKMITGKAVAYVGGHVLSGASQATLQSLSGHVFVNVLSAGAGATTVLGSAVALYSGVQAYKSFAESIDERRREKTGRKPGILAKHPNAMKKGLIKGSFNVLSTAYGQLEMMDENGKLKKDLDQIRINPDEDCLDFNARDDGSDICGACGTPSSHHRPAKANDADISLMLLGLLAAEVYPKLKRRDHKGRSRKTLDAMRPCVECGCTDYRLSPRGVGGACGCYHDPSSHEGLSDFPALEPQEAREMLIEVIAERMYQHFGHRDWNNEPKSFLYEISPHPKSDCPDFNYSWTIPVVDRVMCKCGTKSGAHY